jgi:hypothetical protein
MLRLVAAVLSTAAVTLSAAIAQESTGESQTEPGSDTDLLTDVIEDDAARTELIGRLRTAQAATESETLAPGAEVPPEDLSPGRRIAPITHSIAEGIAERATVTGQQLTRTGSVLDGFSGRQIDVLFDALKDPVLVIGITIGVFIVLRRIGKSIYGRMGASARDGGVARAISPYLALGFIDALIVVLA